MTQSTAENFLRKNRTTIVNGVTKEQCDSLVDFLLAKNILIDESGSEIHTLNTSQKKMRKLLESVKTKKAYELVLQWLRENVRDLIDDLETNSDSDHDAPPKKKSRRQRNNVDEADSCSSQPDLKDLSFPQLEEWVSNSTVSQNLITKLTNKLADGEMDALEKQLKNKKVKTHFCFFANDVKKIESNRKLKSFLDASKDAKFPDLPIELFFAKKVSLQDKSLPEKDSNEDDFTNSTDLNSSGYESLSSKNSSQSIVSKDPLLESKDQTFDSAASNTQHQIESTAQIHQENKDGSKKLDMRESKSTPHVQCDPETARNEPFVEPERVGISEDKKQGMDEVSQKEPKLPADHFQNGSPVQIQNDNKGGTSLAEGLFSMPVSDSGKITGKAKRQPRNTSKLRSEHCRLLYDWALKKCSSEEEIEKVFDCISIQNQVEHRKYPCFVAENIMIYTDPNNGDKQIIVTDDKNKDFKKNLPKEITFIPEYQMWVCGIEKAVVIRNLEERELRFKSFDLILQSCKELVFEALAPALAVFKHIQRQERLYSLTKDH